MGGSVEQRVVEFTAALPCCHVEWDHVCFVSSVCVFASAVFAPSLMEDFSGVTMEKTNILLESAISLKSAILKRLKM